MTAHYDHHDVETKWADRWKKERTFHVDLRNATKPYYNLMMFPYPSAEGLHVGNMFAFTGSDIHGRYKRACGYDVFEPMGFDAFGIHSENFALKTGTHPVELIPRNIQNFRDNQLMKIGAMFDWDRQVTTTDPAYYRWTQWIFVTLFKAGLAYQAEGPVKWCPSCCTVLASEQVEDGMCERCDSLVEQRNMNQWYFRITKYAQRLWDNLSWIDWSKITISSQARWIHRREGAEIRFPVVGSDQVINVFTTRADTVFGATFLVMAPEHSSVDALTIPSQAKAVRAYIHESGRRTDIERESATRIKTGVFTGSYAVNPATGERVPVWVADYVLMTYGSGAVMAVPAHDTRDNEFAHRYGLPVVPVVSTGDRGMENGVYEGEGVLINSGEWTGTDSRKARTAVIQMLSNRGFGEATVSFRLRDWCISRQRYWGPPIPMVHCSNCGPVPVPEDALPVELPYIEDITPDGSGRSPLSRCAAFVETACPQCRGPARRETDVSDTFMDSCWYFFRYLSPGRTVSAIDANLVKKWMPVEMYIGGNEHAVLHLMYSRFITMALNDLGYIEFEEPFKRFRAHGLLIKDCFKMSKSRGNVINPDYYIHKYGADALRMYLMFLGNFRVGGDFSDAGIQGGRRFLDRLWNYVTGTDFQSGPILNQETINRVQETIHKVTFNIERLQYNSVVAAVMELFNGLSKEAQHYADAAKVMLQLIAPVTPHIACELWERIGGDGVISDHPWPDYQPELIVRNVEIAVQVNAKTRGKIVVPPNASEDQIVTEATRLDAVSRLIQGKTIVKTVVVPGRLVNVVLKHGVNPGTGNSL